MNVKESAKHLVRFNNKISNKYTSQIVRHGPDWIYPIEKRTLLGFLWMHSNNNFTRDDNL